MCPCAEPRLQARRISFRGEGNALYPVLSSFPSDVAVGTQHTYLLTNPVNFVQCFDAVGLATARASVQPGECTAVTIPKSLLDSLNSGKCAAGETKLNQGGHKPGKPGMLRDFSEHGKLREFSGNSMQPQGSIVTKYFSSSLKYLCKTAVDWVNRIIRNRDEVRVRW